MSSQKPKLALEDSENTASSNDDSCSEGLGKDEDPEKGLHLSTYHHVHVLLKARNARLQLAPERFWKF